MEEEKTSTQETASQTANQTLSPQVIQTPDTQTSPITQQPKPDFKDEPTQPKKTKSLVFILLGLFILFLIGATGYLGYQYCQLKKQLAEKTTQSLLHTEIPAEIPNPSPDPTANWITYENTKYGYSFKYPFPFKTQVLAAGAGPKEAPPNARGLYVYDSEIEEPYINRYINLEVLGYDKSYSAEWTKTSVSVGGRDITKLVDSSLTSDFDIYIAVVNQSWPLEIYVPNTQNKKSLANQILSTFKFLDDNTEKAKECYENLGCDGPMPCMANPASQFCECMGGEVSIKEGESGQYGTCTIDGTEYEEWEYFKLMNPEDNKYS